MAGLRISRRMMTLIANFRRWFGRGRKGRAEPDHLRRGRLGEEIARRYLQAAGLQHLTSNYRSRHGEIDLIFKDGRCLVFVEVKTRSSEEWNRPAAAVDREKRRRISRTALAYLRAIHHPRVPVRFDVVEVLLAEDQVSEVRHLRMAFSLSKPWRYG